MHVSRHSAAAVFVSDNGGGAFGAHAVAGGRLPSFSTEFFFSLSLSLVGLVVFVELSPVAIWRQVAGAGGVFASSRR